MTGQELDGRAVIARRRCLRFTAGILAGLAIAAAVWFAFRPRLTVPGGDLPGAEPRVAEAVAEARTAVRDAPKSADAWGRLGMTLMAHEYRAQARECFRQAESRDPRDARWVYLRAFTHTDDDPALAAELLERAVALADGPTCRLLLADTLMRLGRVDEAERHYLETADLPEAEARASLGLARIALSRDDSPRALKHAARAARAAPTHRRPAELLAEVYLRAGDAAASGREQARSSGLSESAWPDPYLEGVMRLNVGQAPRLELAQRLLDQGRGRDAVAVLQEVIADNPKSVPATLSLCRAWLRLGQWAAAQASAERALALSPDDAVAWADWGTALGQQDHWNRAADCYRRSIRLNPHDGDTHYQLAFCQLHLKDRPAAERSFRESGGSGPSSPRAGGNWAGCSPKGGQTPRRRPACGVPSN
jgi:tetratricopeptide (TPR) repeat protein